MEDEVETRTDHNTAIGMGDAVEEVAPAAVPAEAIERLEQEMEARGGGFVPAASRAGAVGVTLFDTPASDDATVTLILPPDQLERVPNRAFVRIAGEGATPRTYVGLVTAGPFCEPDGLRGDAPLIVTTAARGAQMFVPRYHGRAEVELVGEEVRGRLRPPRHRPRPNSPAFVLAEAEVAGYLHAAGDIQLGLAVGYEGIAVGIPSDRKSVLPRHLGVLGTTGSGKSTTVSRLIQQAQAAEMAVVVIDVEGEYAAIHEPTDDPTMVDLLEERGLAPAGVPADRVHLYHLVGREAANPAHPDRRAFSLAFDALSPEAVTEILEMNDAQQERFHKAYDAAVEALAQTGLLDQQARLAWDPLERGCPGLTLPMAYEAVRAFAERVERKKLEELA
ncbi:MAG TPA: helicase HerA-like domain-containing protein, partial [Thermomicrobiales bacterium]|nr:helicase HerA-like domain-containing protein [Thermomicrobiales bacterium]